MNTPINTYGVTFKYGSTSATTQVDIKTFPSIFAKKSALETTTMSDSGKTYIDGISQTPEGFDFGCNWDKDVFDTINKLTNVQKCELAFSDGSKFTWDAKLSVSNDDGSVDSVIGMTITAMPVTAPVFSAGSST